MGQINLNIDDRNVKLFNTPIEIGLRCLFLLFKFKESPLSIDKLICLDYFLIHAGDVSKSQKSIHPKYPFRSTEIVIKRELLTNALKLIVSKELAYLVFSTNGIEYKISDIGIKMLEYFESSYSIELNAASEWVYQTFKNYTEEQLHEIINVNIQKWGGEFTNEAKFRSNK